MHEFTLFSFLDLREMPKPCSQSYHRHYALINDGMVYTFFETQLLRPVIMGTVFSYPCPKCKVDFPNFVPSRCVRDENNKNSNEFGCLHSEVRSS